MIDNGLLRACAIETKRMAWKYTALQDKLSSIQSQLLITMEQKSDCSNQGMHLSSNDVQNTHDLKGISLKRKAEDYFPVDNSRSSRSCLMLDMYTQTDRTMITEISLTQVYDLVKRNSERLQKMEEIMMKLNNALENVTDNSPGTRIPLHLATSLPCKKPSSVSAVLIQAQSPTSGARPTFIGTHYPGLSVPNHAFPSSIDYVTQSSEIGDWDGGQERHDIVTAVSTAPSSSENRFVDVNSATGKTSTKEEWNCETSSPTGHDQPPSGPGCWLGDISDVNRRAWFSGDPKVVDRCESYGVNPVKLALSLTEALFTREEMAACNVRGTRGKETLDPSKIKAIRAHVDYKYPIDEDRMEVRWQLIKPKLDSKCRSQRRLQREHKWKFERMSEKPPTSCTPKQKRPVLDVEEREMLLYGSPKTVLNPVVSVYTENTGDPASFSEGQERYLPNPGE